MSEPTPNHEIPPQPSPGAEPERASAPEEGGTAEETVDTLLARKEAEAAELRSQILYLRAEFENFRKRTEKRYRDALEFATEPLTKDLLPVLDNLERAISHAAEASAEGVAPLLEGVEHVLSHFRQTLETHGLQEVAALGERFDPNLHESLAQVPGEEDNRVADVYQKGYLLKGRLLRPSKVVITKVATPPGDG